MDLKLINELFKSISFHFQHNFKIILLKIKIWGSELNVRMSKINQFCFFFVKIRSKIEHMLSWYRLFCIFRIIQQNHWFRITLFNWNSRRFLYRELTHIWNSLPWPRPERQAKSRSIATNLLKFWILNKSKVRHAKLY